MIELKKIKKEYDQTVALENINLSIHEGEFIAIVGPSGCGKTTLLRLLAGFTVPTEGSIFMKGEMIATKENMMPPEQRNIGLVFQKFALWPHMNVFDQIAFPLKHHRFSREISSVKERVQEMLNLVGLQSFSERMPNELSGGQQQRVAIARALAASPQLLLMDEPLSSLDAKLRIELREEIQKIHRTMKPTVVYVTHDQSEALAMADRIVVMNEGKIEQVGIPEDIYYEPLTPFVAKFIGKANLIDGCWREDLFYPFCHNSFSWYVQNIPKNFKEKGICPVRPEQLQIKRNGEGLRGIVENVSFQGREIDYSIKVGDSTVKVIQPAPAVAYIGESVVIEWIKDTLSNKSDPRLPLEV